MFLAFFSAVASNQIFPRFAKLIIFYLLQKKLAKV